MTTETPDPVKRVRAKLDGEMDAMKKVDHILAALRPSEAGRVLTWAHNRHFERQAASTGGGYLARGSVTPAPLEARQSLVGVRPTPHEVAEVSAPLAVLGGPY